jgi:hypothetical protein
MRPSTRCRSPLTYPVGAMVTVVRPVVPGRELLRVAAAGQQIDDFLRDQLVQAAGRADPYPDQGTSGLGDAFGVSRSGADLWVLTSQQATNPSFPYQARAELAADGCLTYWHSPVLNAG